MMVPTKGEPMLTNQYPTSVVRLPWSEVIVQPSQYVVARYQPVQAWIFGAGTGFAVPAGTEVAGLSEGGVLVSATDQGASTAVDVF